MKALLIAAIAWIALTAQPAHAAYVLASDINGIVVDANGKPMAGEVVRIHHHETNRVIEGRTNSKGRYHFSNVRSDGHYTVSHNATSYTGRVRLGQTHRQNFIGEPIRYDSPAHLFSWIWSGPQQKISDIKAANAAQED
ncbi:carboxypeptidase-like regulatory domain-containing protein [Stenotrophomonas maltophilia]|uniref:carboxypeptidase-like regulatory domain-containing protein n=1 Tax=Stenotrophomonas maltophilia TaxID=40324 RepID=UPI001FA6C9CE|nr:carboxypeptidase-like regulatory domain-containing protein [Stenotrophomonas maltophilia]